ncbi:uncharacterized protein [Notamacropus eugenii]|uniref:uncharacterized protein isoform X2 n=1 Tax=Notamacropus eugenii TaxID=9315 RepID=UPI003B674657
MIATSDSCCLGSALWQVQVKGDITSFPSGNCLLESLLGPNSRTLFSDLLSEGWVVINSHRFYSLLMAEKNLTPSKHGLSQF